MTRRQCGFTLIELLIAVAIVGILSAIAVPAYRDIVLKANAQEAITLLDSLSKKAVLYYSQHGSWPDNNAQIANTDPTVSVEASNYATDVIDAAYFRNRYLGGDTGEVFVRVKATTLGNPEKAHLRAIITHRNGSFDIDWCNQQGSYATDEVILPYVGC